MMRHVGLSLGTILTCLMEFFPTTSSARVGWLSLILLAVLSSPSLQKSLPPAYRDHQGPQEGTGLIRCGEYSNQVLPNGRCKIVATLPQGDEQRCPDMFRCTDEVSYWLHENEERKQQVLELRELISELQEELRNHRHRIKVLELQHEEAAGRNHSLAQRVQDLEHRYSEASTLQHIQATLLYDMQAQINNISVLTDWAWRNPTCLGPAEMRLQEEMHHPEVKHGRNCPIDCASVYYNGLRRSGVYSIMPSVGGMPIEVLCEMETEGTAGGTYNVFQQNFGWDLSNWRVVSYI